MPEPIAMELAQMIDKFMKINSIDFGPSNFQNDHHGSHFGFNAEWFPDDNFEMLKPIDMRFPQIVNKSMRRNPIDIGQNAIQNGRHGSDFVFLIFELKTIYINDQISTILFISTKHWVQ